MTEPIVVPRAEHSISRKAIDPEALKVLYRLHQSGHAAYLVGGSVRDLLLGRRPKDFDIGTSAHPYEVKKLFRNCWIIGRRFRLAHVRFGPKAIEVATFRRQVSAEELAAAEEAAVEDAAAREATQLAPEDREGTPDAPPSHDRHGHRDNTFGTAEEDAFRRDFTINALFYDIGTFSIIDYTGGLKDLGDRVLRCIGDPRERFVDDPVRMIRAVSMASRLDFQIDAPIDAAIATTRGEIARAAPARLIEELYKLLRSGASETAFRMLAERRLFEPLSTDLQARAGEALWASLARLDAYRKRFAELPDTLTNAILLGSILVPIHQANRNLRGDAPDREPGSRDPRLALGLLPLARRDVDRLGLVLATQRRLMDQHLSPRGKRSLMHRSHFKDALTWLEIHGDAPEVLEHWKGFAEAAVTYEGETPAPDPQRRRRRRRRRRRPTPSAVG